MLTASRKPVILAIARVCGALIVMGARACVVGRPAPAWMSLAPLPTCRHGQRCGDFRFASVQARASPCLRP
jgi:hypothetical protein